MAAHLCRAFREERHAVEEMQTCPTVEDLTVDIAARTASTQGTAVAITR